MLKKAMDWARRHLILFGTAKFIAGLVIGFGLGVYFLPILTAEKGLDETQLNLCLQDAVKLRIPKKISSKSKISLFRLRRLRPSGIFRLKSLMV